MKKLFLLACLALSACDGSNPFQSKAPPAPNPDVVQVIGSGQILRAPGVAVMVGPANVARGYAHIPVFVQDAPPMIGAKTYPAASCLLYDAQHRLVTTIGGIIPAKFQGGNLEVEVMRPIASVNCQLASVSAFSQQRLQ